MKLVFLDFDGVLVNREALMRGFPGYGHPDCVAALNKILDQTGAKIVVSSSWRFEGLEAMRQHLKAWGVRARPIAMTPTIFASRGMEIDKYLRLHGRPESFVILDDDSDMEPYKDRLVQTEFEAGLTIRDAERAIELLEGRAA